MTTTATVAIYIPTRSARVNGDVSVLRLPVRVLAFVLGLDELIGISSASIQTLIHKS